MVSKMKFCPICWGKVFRDGCAFYCKKCSKEIGVFNPFGIIWIDCEAVFDTETGSYGVKPFRMGEELSSLSTGILKNE